MDLSNTLKRAAREPLLHFLFLGLLLFGADHVLNARREDPQTITVGTDVQKEVREIFVAGMKREPTPGDMQKLVDRWVDNEVLYREGLSLGLDRGDSTIRERVIFKAMSIARSGLSLPPIDEAKLRAWFEARHERYDTPARYDFMEAVVIGDSTPETLETFASALNGTARSDTQSDLRVFKDRPHTNLVESYGSEFATRLTQLKVGEWQAVPSSAGLRVVRVEAIKLGTTAKFDDMKDSVHQDWKDDTMAQLTSDAVREMGKKYTVRMEEQKP
jgi:PPIC-type PPIASE domain